MCVRVKITVASFNRPQHYRFGIKYIIHTNRLSGRPQAHSASIPSTIQSLSATLGPREAVCDATPLLDFPFPDAEVVGTIERRSFAMNVFTI